MTNRIHRPSQNYLNSMKSNTSNGVTRRLPDGYQTDKKTTLTSQQKQRIQLPSSVLWILKGQRDCPYSPRSKSHKSRANESSLSTEALRQSPVSESQGDCGSYKSKDKVELAMHENTYTPYVRNRM